METLNEKASTVNVETVEKVPFEPGSEHLDSVDTSLEQRVVRKCDRNLIPILSVLMLLCFLDRVNIGNARIQGLPADLHMKGDDFNVALFIFFVTYILCDIPSNIMLKHVRPSIWLSGLMVGWGRLSISTTLACSDHILGIITTLQGVTQSVAGLIVCRFFLGVFEAGFFPGRRNLISPIHR
jgi:MFS family permease